MTNNENWVKNNSEVETEEKENGAVVLTGTAEEQIVEDENTSDDVVEVVDETSEETEDEVADKVVNISVCFKIVFANQMAHFNIPVKPSHRFSHFG